MIKDEKEAHHEKMASNIADIISSSGSSEYQFFHV
jgi:hypothetical protein